MDPINWHENETVQCVLDRLSEKNTKLERQTAIPADFYEIRGATRLGCEAIDALHVIREVSIDAAVGYSFQKSSVGSVPWDDEKGNKWMDVNIATPTVTQVVRDALRAREKAA